MLLLPKVPATNVCQFNKVKEEFDEFAESLSTKDVAGQLEELWDCRHALDQLLHQYIEVYGFDAVVDGMLFVIDKNDKRRLYDGKNTSHRT